LIYVLFLIFWIGYFIGEVRSGHVEEVSVSWIKDNGLRSAIPTLQAMDFAGLALSPEEGFVLSRVDGRSTIEEICLLAGMGDGKTLDALAKLHDSMLIEIPGAPARQSAQAEPSPADGADEEGAPTEPMAPPFSVEEGVQLSEKKQREVHALYYGLDAMEFYDLLSLEKGCTNKDIQRAYRKVSKQYHPDRFYGKDLGSYKNKLEAIFRHISNVVEYLTDDDERTAYEASLGSPEPEPEPANEDPTTDELEPVRRRPRHLTKKDRLRRLGGVMGMSTKEVQAAARKRKGTPQPQPKAGALRTDRAPEVSAERKARIKKRRRKQTQQIMSPIVQRRAKAKRHYEEGIKLLLDGNFAAAASNLKLATTFDPKNEEYAEKEQIATSRAREGSAVAYAKRAAFEESVGRWEEAARLYCMAAERSPTVELFCQAADALSKGDDLKRAVEYATRAKDLEPNSIQARLSLGTAYLAADMPKNARREVEYALNLDSDNPLAKTLMKEVRKADR